jgi:hypothetical protein
MVETSSESFLNTQTPVVESPTVESPTVKSPTVESPFDYQMDIGPFSPFAEQAEDPEDWFEARRKRKREERDAQKDLEMAVGSSMSIQEIQDILESSGKSGQKIAKKLEDMSTQKVTASPISLTPLLPEIDANLNFDQNTGVVTIVDPSVAIPSVAPIVADVVSATGPAGIVTLGPSTAAATAATAPAGQLIPPTYDVATSEVGLAASEAVSTVADVAIKSASVVGAIMAIDRFAEDPNLETGAYAVGATAAAGSLFGSELAKSVAGVTNPLLIAYTGIKIFEGLTYDADYYRSQGIVEYRNGEWASSGVQGADGGKKQWGEGQTKVAVDSLNTLINEYGFEVNETKLNSSTFQKKLKIMNNPTYAKMKGQDASLNAQQVVMSALREGVLAPTDATPDDISSNPEKFSEFIGGFVTKMSDDYATYIWTQYGGAEDRYGNSRFGIKEKYAAFGSEKAANEFAGQYNNTAPKITNLYTGTGRGQKYAPSFTKTTLTTTRQDVQGDRGAVYFGGFGFEQEDAEYNIMLSSSSKKTGTATYSFSTLEEAELKADQLNKGASAYIVKERRTRGPAKENVVIDDYAVGLLDGKYVIGNRQKIVES